MLRTAARHLASPCRHCRALLRPTLPSSSLCTRLRPRLLHTTPPYAYPRLNRVPRTEIRAEELQAEENDVPMIEMDESSWEQLMQTAGIGKMSASWVVHLARIEEFPDEQLLHYLFGDRSGEGYADPLVPRREAVYRLFSLLPKSERDLQLSRRLLQLAFAGGSQPDSVPAAGFRLLRDKNLGLTVTEFDRIYAALLKMEYWPVLFLKAHRAAEQWRLLQGAAPSRIAESFPQMSEQELAERERKRLGQMEVLRKECVDALEFGWKKGVHLCANYMGELYAHGWVVRRSGKMARQWWEWAAENGSVQAMKHLGRHLGVFRDPTKRRLMHVQVDLALSYNKQAAPWSGTAAHQAAQYYWRPVGETRAHHRQRWGVEADDEEAAKWFYYGVRTGHVYCRLGLARMMLEKRVKLDQLAQWEVERLELLARDDPDASETTEWDEVATDENGAPDPLAAPEMDVYLLHAAGIKRAVKVQHRLNPDGSITTNKYEVFVGEYGNPEDVKYARRLQKQNKRVKREGGTARWAVKHHLELGGGVENQTTTQFEEELEMGLEDHDELEQVHDAPRKQEVEDFTDGFDIPSHLLTGNSGNPARSPHAYLDTGFNLVMTSEAEMLADARKRVEEWMLHLRCAGALIDGVPISDRRPLPGPLPDPLPGTGLATWPAPWSSPGTTVAKVGDDTLFGRGRDRRAEVESLQRLLRKQERQAGELLGDERALKEWRRGQERGERKLCNRLAPPSEREQRDEQEQDPIAKWRRPEQHEAIAPMRYGAKKSRQMRGLMDVLALNGRDEVEMEMEFEADPADKTVSVYSPSLPFSASGRSAVHSIASAGTRESERERRRGRPKATNQGLQSLVSVLAQNGREVESDPSASPSHSPFPEPEPEPLHQRSPSQVPSPSSRTRGGVSGTSERGGRKWEDQRDVFEDVLGL